MIQVDVQTAQARLSQLIQQVIDGEEVIIAQGDLPVVRLIAINGSKPRRRLGSAKGQIWMAEDFNATPDDFAEYLQ